MTTVCEPCKEACAREAEEYSKQLIVDDHPRRVAFTIAARIRSLPSQPGDVRWLVTALERIRDNRCYDLDGKLHYPADIASTALEAWRRRSSPERPSLRPAREVAYEIRGELLTKSNGDGETLEIITAALEADRRQRP